MLIFPTQQLAENYFANGLRLVTTAKDFFKDLDKAFYNWSEGNVQVDEWDKDRAEIINSYNK
jgi:hypothetical protein